MHPLDGDHSRDRAAQLDSNGLPPYDKMPFRMPEPIQGGARMPSLQEAVFRGLKTGIAGKPCLQDERVMSIGVNSADTRREKEWISTLLARLFND